MRDYPPGHVFFLGQSGHALLHCICLLMTQSGHMLGVHWTNTVLFCTDTEPNQIENAGSCVSQAGLAQCKSVANVR